MSIASEREDRMRVAKTILEQLGGNKFRMMTGARISQEMKTLCQ